MYAFRVSGDDSNEVGALLAWLAAGLDKKRGKTQEGLAKALGISQPRVSEILNRKRQIKLTELPKIAEYLGQSPPIDWSRPDHLAPSDLSAANSHKNRREIRFGLHDDAKLVWVLILRDGTIVDQFEADGTDLDNLSRAVARAIQSLSGKK